MTGTRVYFAISRQGRLLKNEVMDLQATTFKCSASSIRLISNGDFNGVALKFCNSDGSKFLVVLVLPKLARITKGRGGSCRGGECVFRVFFKFDVFSLQRPLFSYS